MPRIPDPDEFARQWALVDGTDRRRILRCVNKGEQLDDRRDAALAVVLSRRQQRFWRFAWLFGPVISIVVALVIDLDGGWVQIAANALLGAAVLIAMSVWYSRRAKRAEELNTQHAIHGRKRGRD